MDVKEFVRDTLIQIVEGVIAAHEAVKGQGASVNAHDELHALPSDSRNREIREVAFDVAVTTESSTGAEAKVAVWSIGLGADGSSASSVVSRIQFKVPVALPRPKE